MEILVTKFSCFITIFYTFAGYLISLLCLIMCKNIMHNKLILPSPTKFVGIYKISMEGEINYSISYTQIHLHLWLFHTGIMKMNFIQTDRFHDG